jgi:hypothetical protein
MNGMSSHHSAPADTSGEAPRSSVVNRYGTPKRALGKRARIAGIAAGLVLAIAASALVAWWNTATLTSKDIAFEILSPTRATVTFDVEKSAGDDVECSVRVLSESYAVVGWKSIVLPAGEGGGREKIRSTVELRTESLGVSGGVGDCWTL